MTTTSWKEELQATLDAEGLPVTVLTAEVVVEPDEAVEYATRLLGRVMSYLEASREKTIRAQAVAHTRRIRRQLRDMGLTDVQVTRAMPRFKSEAIAMLTYTYDVAAEDLRNRLRMDFSMHLIPRLHKETEQ